MSQKDDPCKQNGWPKRQIPRSVCMHCDDEDCYKVLTKEERWKYTPPSCHRCKKDIIDLIFTIPPDSKHQYCAACYKILMTHTQATIAEFSEDCDQ